MPIDMHGLVPLIEVFDMPRSLAFYRDTLGFAMVGQSSPGDYCNWAWLRSGTAEVMLNTAYDPGTRPPEPDPARQAAHRDTCLFIGCPDTDAAYRHLVERGVEVKPPTVAPYGMKQLWFRDPDGYGICLQWPAGS